MKEPIIIKSRAHVADLYKQFDAVDTLFYHNWFHVKRVTKEAINIADNSGLDTKQKEAIEIAALFHDTGYLIDPKNHEEAGVQVAIDFLKQNEYNDPEQIEKISQLIMITKMGSSPTTLEEKIMKDADMSHFGSIEYEKDYFNLLKELQVHHGIELSDSEWKLKTIQFMENHNYFTDFAKQKFDRQKAKNITKIKSIMTDKKPMEESVISEPKKKSKKKKEKNTNIPEKGIETMFRVALRNHLSLSQIADNKANTLISVNGIIISIVLSALFPKLDTNPFLIFPAFSLLGFSVITVILSIFSTIPNTTHGKLSREDISQKKGNLLFFGNFHSMSLADFEWGISEVMKDKDYLYKNLTRDLYFLGKVLNKKYRLLRYSYFSFVIGLFISITLFVFSLRVM